MKDGQIMTGKYSLILFGARHGFDLETIAFLDYEGDDTTFEPFSPEYDYKVKHHVEDEQALTEALKFISWYPSYLKARLSRITDMEDRILGYEVRPLYLPTTSFAHFDVLNVNYMLQEKKVVVRIQLKRSVESELEGNGGDRRSN
jgi:hypothetical protein